MNMTYYLDELKDYLKTRDTIKMSILKTQFNKVNDLIVSEGFKLVNKDYSYEWVICEYTKL